MVPAALRPVRAGALALGDLAAALHLPAPPGAAAVVLRGAALDSRRVEPGDLYAALPGAATHGARFAGAAAAAGAAAVLTDPAGAQLLERAGGAGAALPVLVADDPRALLGRASALVHGEPARDLLLLAVTGTNGKTTTTTVLEEALAATGTRTGLIGTVCTRVDGVALPSARTTPEAPDLHALLALMRERGAGAVAMEVSSHAVVLHRVDGLVFDVVAFTNLSRDHLDFHPSMEDYFAAKAALFDPARARAGVVCVDDDWGRRLAERARAAGLPTTTVSTTGAAADWRLDPATTGPRTDGGAGERGVLVGPGTRVELASPLPGSFNTANTAVALVVMVTAGMDADRAARALAAVGGVPGRMEVVPAPPGAPRGIVDYAHTPDAVALALGALRPSTPGLLVVVLGAGGDRDRAKRPQMGRAAALGADVVVVTDDNPRGEDPASIRAAVLAGAHDAGAHHAGTHDPGARVLEVASRAQAVAVAVAQAAAVAGSTVLVAGKGHEQGQEVAGVVHPFDDRAVLTAALAEAPAPAPQAAGSAR